MKKVLLFLSLFLSVHTSYSQGYLLDEFKLCIAVAKGGMPIQEKFNYNCVTQAMEFMNGKDILRLEPINQIDTLYLDGHKMIPYGIRFLEVFYRSVEFSLLIDHKRKIMEDGKIGAMGIKTQNGVQNVDRRTLGADFRQDWERGVDVYTYKDETSYWLKTGRKMKRFRDMKTLIKILPEKKMMIERYVMEYNTDFSNHKEVLELLKSCF